jgi:DNA-binding Lrp family transcriptional regulator
MIAELDQRLISALRHDARASLSDLALLLGVSRTTVRSRMEKLKNAGEILGFSVVLKDDVKADPVRGVMLIGVQGRGAERVMRMMQGLPQVRVIHATNGRWDLIAEIGTRTLEEFDSVLANIRRFEGVSISETNLLLRTRKLG